MAFRPYHKRYHSDALSGFMSLDLEERGAYQTILDMIYDNNGPLFDNERLLSGYMQCSIRKWKSLRQSLLEKGKIYLTSEGKISNSRCDFEIENFAKTSRKRAENGLKGGRSKAENAKNANKNNDGGLAKSQQSSSHTRVYPESRTTLPNGNAKSDEKLGQPIDRRKQVWDDAKSLLGSKRSSLIAKWEKEFGLEALGSAVAAAKAVNAFEPAEYVAGVLRKGGQQDFNDVLTQRRREQEAWEARQAAGEVAQ